MNRVTAFAIAVTVAIIAIILLLAQCQDNRVAGTKARVDQAQDGAFAGSAADAIAVQGNAAARERGSAELDRTNERDIRNAPGAEQQIDPRAGAAGKRALCLRDAYRDRPECRLQQPAAR